VIGTYGEYVLSIVNSNTLMQVSDENLLLIVILPIPTIVAYTPLISYVTT
jgi:hypothetical protein